MDRTRKKGGARGEEIEQGIFYLCKGAVVVGTLAFGRPGGNDCFNVSAFTFFLLFFWLERERGRSREGRGIWH